MSSLVNKRIVLGITGGIAAYKSPDLVRRLRDLGADVRVVMTNGACAFIAPLTLQAVSGHDVHTQLLDAGTESAMGHIELARWADAIVVAPASADFIARLDQGRSDDLLTAVCLARDCPLAVAPAMNRQMWDNPATRANVARLRERGATILGPGRGEQACGETGEGRMLEPVELATAVAGMFETGALAGLRALVTAGPTFEPLDPVRGLTNRSSGRMGYALAEAAAEAGAAVTLISGPTALPDPDRVTTVRVTTALEMHAAVMQRLAGQDVFIGVAAVADYRPANPEQRKIKKAAGRMTLELVRNPDILAEVAASSPRPFVVGFAAETDDLEEEARRKLRAKGADLIAANQVGRPGSGFESEDNALLVIDAAGTRSLGPAPKGRLARQLIEIIAGHYHAAHQPADSRLAHRG